MYATETSQYNVKKKIATFLCGLIQEITQSRLSVLKKKNNNCLIFLDLI